jgi:hypothetical protein
MDTHATIGELLQALFSNGRVLGLRKETREALVLARVSSNLAVAS